MKDPLAPWRNELPVTFNEAARLVLDIPGSRGYRMYAKLSEERKEECDNVQDMLKRLCAAAMKPPGEAWRLEAEIVYSKPDGSGQAAHGMGNREWRERDSPAPAPVPDAAIEINPSASTITRDALRAWCEANGLRPSVLFPDADKPLGTSERENLLRLIGVLCELAGIDLRTDTKGHAEARRIAEAMEKRNVKIGKETVAKNIAAARNLIAPKGPEELPSDSN